jgi:FtsP/CotA-like multicopper oxidase with cupredoxin domain
MMAGMMGFLGDRILVNGKPDFVLPVESRAYRLRLLNGSNTRIHKLAWSDGSGDRDRHRRRIGRETFYTPLRHAIAGRTSRATGGSQRSKPSARCRVFPSKAIWRWAE